jgi:hypothetical protein
MLERSWVFLFNLYFDFNIFQYIYIYMENPSKPRPEQVRQALSKVDFWVSTKIFESDKASTYFPFVVNR